MSTSKKIIILLFFGLWLVPQSGFTQSTLGIEIELQDLRKIDQCLQEWPILQDLVRKQDETNKKLEDSLATEKKLREIAERELALEQKISGIKDMENAMLRKGIEDLGKISDRAIKLVEISKPQSNWKVYGIAGLALFLAGILIGK